MLFFIILCKSLQRMSDFPAEKFKIMQIFAEGGIFFAKYYKFLQILAEIGKKLQKTCKFLQKNS